MCAFENKLLVSYPICLLGERHDSPAVQRAVQFLLSKQRRNGGWGESYLACINKEYPAEGTGEVR